MIYCFDLDGTICSSVENSRYNESVPDIVIVKEINRLYDEGNKIIIMTARGCNSGIDNTDLTTSQLQKWGIKYHELIMNKKPHAHFFIDDKAINIIDWKKSITSVKGIIAGAFDLIHPGYCKMFKECKEYCNNLTVALHENPSIERNKLSPIHTIEERKEILESIKYIDNVVVYKTEEDWFNLLDSDEYDIRFLGSDYKNQNYTGKELSIPVHFLNRDHDYSTTKLKMKIVNNIES